VQVQRAPDYGSVVVVAGLPGLLHGISDSGDDSHVHSFATEHGVQAPGIHLCRERVIGDYLREFGSGDDHDGRPHGKPGGDLQLESVSELGRIGLGRAEYQVAALDIGRHIAMAEPGRELAEVGHRHLVMTPDVDAPQQGQVSGHEPHYNVLSALACCDGSRKLTSGLMSGQGATEQLNCDPAADPGAPQSQTGWSPSRERTALGEALRRLLDVVVQTGASPAELRAAASAIDSVTASLASPVVRTDMATDRDSYRAHMSLVGGLSHPAAPQLVLEQGENIVTGQVTVGTVFQGGPGLVHGGVLALLIDHAMGCVAAGPQRPAMTVQLSLRYRRPTPIGVPLTVAAQLDRIEGRKLHLSATISADGQVTVDADAIFLTLTTENLENVFARGRAADGWAATGTASRRLGTLLRHPAAVSRT
jgi:acyl-coenzyme A thioesterase PaaI-like protein